MNYLLWVCCNGCDVVSLEDEYDKQEDENYRDRVERDRRVSLRLLANDLDNLKIHGGSIDDMRLYRDGIENLDELYLYLKEKKDKYDIVEFECQRQPEKKFLGFTFQKEKIICLHMKFKTGKIGKFEDRRI